MSHPRGLVTFEAAGEVWKLKFGVNALADLEERTGESVYEIFASLSGDALRLSTLRVVLASGMRQHHPALTLPAVGDLMDEVGMAQIGKLIEAALRAAFPEATKPGEAPAGV